MAGEHPETTPFYGYVGDLTPLQDVGKWDGTTPSRILTNYEDRAQATVPFGMRSFFATPWRAYMDTQPASTYMYNIATAANGPHPDEFAACMKMMAAAGLKHLRIELPWYGMEYDDPTIMQPGKRAEFDAMFAVLQQYKIRPTILLNSNQGLPCPYKNIQVTFTQPVVEGALEVYINPAQVPLIVPRYTGFGGGRAMFPCITSADAVTGKCSLSSAITSEHVFPSGAEATLIILKYTPIGATEPGTPPEIIADTQASLDAFVARVGVIKNLVAPYVASTGDAGFDLEVFNEYTFGSSWFTGLQYYYDSRLVLPPTRIKFEGQNYPSNTNNPEITCEVLFNMVVSHIKNNPTLYPKVRVANGFGNQAPWTNSRWMYPGGDVAVTRHYYTGYDDASYRLLTNETLIDDRKQTWLDALGNRDQSAPDGFAYMPPHISAFPEHWMCYYKTESHSRDVVPFEDIFANHGRFTTDRNDKPAEVWQTEINTWRQNWMRETCAKAGFGDLDSIEPATGKIMYDTPFVRALDEYFGAKIAARHYTFFAHKGQDRTYLYRLKDGSPGFGIISMNFYEALNANGNVLNPEIEDLVGPQVKTIVRMTNVMKSGAPIENTRNLKVDRIVEYQPRYVWKGDGTPAHPDRFHGEDMAILPYQMANNKFCVHYYVMTRDIRHTWDDSKDYFDSARYDMPEQDFDITLSNIVGNGAVVSAYDPITDTNVPVTVVSSTATTITVKVKALDYPRMLMIEEATTGPLLVSTKVEKTATGGKVTFIPTESGTVDITWGSFPTRQTSKFTQKRFTAKENWSGTPVETKDVEVIDFPGKLSSASGSHEWTGQITPKYSETYLFSLGTDAGAGLDLDGIPVIVMNSGIYRGSIALVAGQTYDLRLRYWTNYDTQGPHWMTMKWVSPSQTFEVVPGTTTPNIVTLSVTRNQPVVVDLPGLTELQGVKVSLTTPSLLKTSYPWWDGDVKGVVYSTTPLFNAANTPGPLVPISMEGTVYVDKSTEFAPAVITFGWSASAGADSYDYVTSTGLSGNTTGASVSIGSQTAGTYTITVTAKNANGSGPSGVGSLVLADQDLTPPVVPVGVTASASSGQVFLRWQANTDADFLKYKVYKDGLLLVEVIKAKNYFVATGLPNGVSVTFTVTAVDTSGNESAHSLPVASTPQLLVRTGTIIARDTYNRPDTEFGMGEAAPGGAYGLFGGNYRIINGTIEGTTTGGNTGVLSTGASDGLISITLKSPITTAAGLVFRAQENSDMFSVQMYQNSISLSRNQSGGNNAQLGSAASPAADGDVISVVMNGTSITVYHNDVERISVVDANHTGNVRHGVTAIGTGTRLDNFELRALALPPSAPTGFITSNVTTNSIDLQWAAVAGATNYEVKRGAAIIYAGPLTTFSDGGRSAGTNYAYTVTASNANGVGQSSAVSATTTGSGGGTPPPVIVGSLSGKVYASASGNAPAPVTFTWDAVTNAASYDYVTNTGLNGNTGGTTLSLGTRQAGTYTITVTPKNGTETGSSGTATTTLQTAPVAIGSLSGKVYASTSGNAPAPVTFTWDVVSNAASYDYVTNTGLSGNMAGTTLTLGTQQAGTYTVTVTARNGTATGSSGTATTTLTSVAPPQGPSALAGLALASSGHEPATLTATWQPSTNVTSYSYSLAGPITATGTTTATNVSFTSATVGSYTLTVTPNGTIAGVSGSASISVTKAPLGGMSIQTVINEADLLTPNAFDVTEKVFWLNEINRTVFEMVKIPKTYMFDAKKGVPDYPLPSDVRLRNIDRVIVGTSYYGSLNMDNVKPGHNGFAFDETVSYVMSLHPVPTYDTKGHVRYMQAATVNYVTANLDLQTPEAPGAYHELYVLALAEKMAIAMYDTDKSSKYGSQFQLQLSVAQAHYAQQAGPPSA